MDGLSATVFLLKLSLPKFNAVLKAHFHFYKSLKILRQKRDKLLLNTRGNNHKEIYSRSIVVDYFIRKKHFFNKLLFVN